VWMYDKNYAAAEKKLNQIEQQINEAKPALQRANSIRYHLVMQRALLASHRGETAKAEQLYIEAKAMLKEKRSDLIL
ncbi:tetratricopeptide repeat protein, partial [Vibrio astriarenae]